MTQEMTRSSADDVPRAQAQRAADTLSRGGAPAQVAPAAATDLATDVGPFVTLYGANGAVQATTAQLDAVCRKYRAQSWPRPRRTASTESPGSRARVCVKRSSRCHGAGPPHRQWWSRGPAFGHLKIDRPNCCCLWWLAGRDDRLPGDDRGRSPMAGFGQTWPPEQLTFGFTGDWNNTRAERGAASPCPTAGAQPCTRLPCPAHSASRNSTLRILPVAVLGSDSTISTWSGAL